MLSRSLAASCPTASQGYKDLYSRKLEYTEELATQIQAGLQKMSEAKEDVNKMKAQLAVKNVELAAAAREAEVLLKSISESTAVAEKEKQKVAVIVDGVSGQGCPAEQLRCTPGLGANPHRVQISGMIMCKASPVLPVQSSCGALSSAQALHLVQSLTQASWLAPPCCR